MKLNQNRPYYAGVRFEDADPKSGVYPPLKIGGLKPTFFRRLCNLTAAFTAYIFGMKQDIYNRANALETATVLLHCLNMS